MRRYCGILICLLSTVYVPPFLPFLPSSIIPSIHTLPCPSPLLRRDESGKKKLIQTPSLLQQTALHRHPPHETVAARRQPRPQPPPRGSRRAGQGRQKRQRESGAGFYGGLVDEQTRCERVGFFFKKNNRRGGRGGRGGGLLA